MPVDTKDRKILQELVRDARQSVRQIGRRTGIRPSTVHQRMARLVRTGIIESYTVRIDEAALGSRLTVFMLVSGTTERYLDDEFLRDPRVVEIHAVTGEYDMLLKLRFQDLEGFSQFLIGFRERFHAHIAKTVTMVATGRLDDPSRPPAAVSGPPADLRPRGRTPARPGTVRQ